MSKTSKDEKKTTMTEADIEKVTEERDPEKITEDEADEVVTEIVDFGGRRIVPLPNGERLFIRNATQSESEAAEAAYSMYLFKCHKEDGLPYIAQICREVLTMVDNPDTFGFREKTIINQKEIEDTIEANKTLMLAWEEEKKTNPEAPEPELLEAEEPIPDDGSLSLKDILSDPDISPFEKTSLLMQCLARTEFANLTMNCAEYRAGKARNRRTIMSITERGEEVNGTMKFYKYWKTKEEFDASNPEMVGYIEMVYTAYMNEVNSQGFLQRLSNVLLDGDSKS
jgi:hypothetical protein